MNTVSVKVRCNSGICYTARAGEGRAARTASSTSDALTAAKRAAAKFLLGDRHQDQQQLSRIKTLVASTFISGNSYYEFSLEGDSK